MLPSLLFALAASATTYAQVAEWHMDTLDTLVMERLDPIVSPNEVAGHMHRILGGSSFGAAYSFAAARNSSCTSASITADKSNYWVPQLYWLNGANSFIPLPAFTRFYYKLGRNSGSEPVAPFPEGLRMLTGDPSSKAPTGAATFTCHVNSDLITGSLNRNNFNFGRDCPYGLRVEFFFPPCWDGANLYMPDQSHMAFPTSGDKAKGQCPWTHPIRIPAIMLEYTFRPSSWAPGQALAGNLAWANGDTTGYGAHADFTNGWDTEILATALNNTQCAGNIGSMSIEQCEVLRPYYDPNAAKSCKPDKGVMYEVGQKNQDLVPIPALPGCNPIWGNTTTKPTCDSPPTDPDVGPFTGVDGSLFPASFLAALPTVPGWQQLGCIKDTGTILASTSSWFYDDKLTATQCQSICLMNGMRYAAIGMSDSRWDCQCGTGVVNDASVYPGMCVNPCPGNSSQTCGATDVHAIWYAPPGTVASPEKVSGPDSDSYLGCYSINHSRGSTLISGRMSAFDADEMTNEYCIDQCASQGATWAATTNSHTCSCGKNYALGDGFYVSDASCSWGCSGNNNEKCGAYKSYFSVYNVTGTAVPSDSPSDGPSFPSGRNGCYQDPGSKGLSGISWTNTAMTVEQCQYGCAELNYTLAGVTGGNRCRCGNAWNGGPLYPNSQCSATCTGDRNETCGGNYLTEVYQTAPLLPKVQADISARPVGWSGCYTNSAGKLFPSLNRYDSKNNVERCKATCGGLNYSWGAVENQYYCKCGNVDPSTIQSRLPSNVYCTKACPGNSSETCGAPGHYSEAYDLASPNATDSSPDLEQSPSGASASSVGCFGDPGTMGGVSYSSGYMTVDVCLFYCKASGYSHAGLYQGNTCRCSNTTPKIHVGQQYCNTPCPSNANQTCGSSNNVQVWPVSASPNFIDPYTAAAADANGYMGCWNDWKTRMLNGSSYSSNSMTTSACRFNCLAQGYTYSGTESGNTCYCSNALTTNQGYQRRPDSECGLSCFGNRSIKCGGTWRISIFAAQAPASSSTVSVAPSSTSTSTPISTPDTISTSSASTPSASPSLPPSEYQGCYALGTLKSASKTFLGYGAMTPQFCQRYCMAYGYDIGGLQGGNNCYCGSMSNLGTLQSDNACNAVCSGDSSQTCGDTYLTSVYISSPAAPGYPTDYVGCFNDGSKRVLGGFKATTGSMNSGVCKAICNAKGYTIYGTEAGNQCYCGNAIPPSMIGDEKCSYTCSGGREKCGGSWKLSVYKAGWANETVQDSAPSSSAMASSTAPSTTSSTVFSTIALTTSSTLGSTSQTPGPSSNVSASAPISSATKGDLIMTRGTTSTSSSASTSSPNSLSPTTSSRPAPSASSSSPGPSSPSPSGFLGCFPASSNPMSDTITSSKLTVTNCQAWCRANLFGYAAVSNGTTCGCTNTTPSTSLPATQCSVHCAGDSTASCGGTTNWAVFSVPSTCVAPTRRDHLVSGP